MTINLQGIIADDVCEASTKMAYISYSAMNKRNDHIFIPKLFVLAELSTSGDTLLDHHAVTIEIDTLI